MKKKAVDISVEEIAAVLDSLLQNQNQLEDTKKSLDESLSSLENILKEAGEEPAFEVENA
jgi:DNA-binding transcriptional MerR regulator